MFKNLNVYRTDPPWTATVAEMQDALSKLRFVECGATQMVSAGWVAPRGNEDALLVENIGGQQLLALMVERKLLPSAFTKRATFKIWIDPKAQLLIVDAGSAARADEVVTQLVQSLPGLAVKPLHTAQTAAAVMADWLLNGEPPAVFAVDRECELKAEDEMKSVVRYARHRLDTDEVREHIRTGKRPTRLALTWNGRVSFVLTDAGLVKKLDFLDVVFENKPSRANADEAFDADAAIATGELVKLIPDLVDALGGEQQPGSAESAA